MASVLALQTFDSAPPHGTSPYGLRFAQSKTPTSLRCFSNSFIESGKERFTKFMPEDAKTTEEAELNNWSDEKLAKKIDCSINVAKELRQSYRRASVIIDQESLSATFRQSVISSIKNALEQGLQSEEDINDLAEQICYRAADLSYLLTLEGKELSDYSDALRT